MSPVKERVLVVFADALGARQIEALGEALRDPLPHRTTLRGILGYSSGALATVLTGATAAQHGRMCLFAARKDAAPGLLEPLTWLGLLPRVVHERARVRRLAARWIARREGLSGYVAMHRVPPALFHWLDLPERDDLFRTDAVGGQPTFLADARRAGLSVYAAPWQLGEDERFTHTHAALARETPDLAFLYATALDGSLHHDGNDSRAGRTALETLAGHIGRARDVMSRGGVPLTTLLVGDHGMADVNAVVDPRPALAALAGERVFVDSTMLRVWGDAHALERARVAVDRIHAPGRWLDREALAERGAAIEGDPYGRAIFLLDEGVIFAPSFVGGRVRGMHGYDVDSVSARAALASDRPIPEHARSLTDFAGLVRTRLGLGSAS